MLHVPALRDVSTSSYISHIKPDLAGSQQAYTYNNSLFVHGQKISSMSAAWLLPIIPTIVASASGGIVANILPNPQHALWTLVTSYILWGTGVPLAMLVLCI